MKQQQMEVEIWSDVMCPFCYIGKRKFETALENFKAKDAVKIIWKSFQLNPELETDPSISNAEYLAKHKGISQKEAEQMGDYVAERAMEVGLSLHFDKVVLANTFKAHRLIHWAKSVGKQIELKEKLFEAFFTLGKNIDDNGVLLELIDALGLDSNKAKQCLESEAYSAEVLQDIYEAQQVGVRGVPFFVFNNKYAVSGAQEPATFEAALSKAYS